MLYHFNKAGKTKNTTSVEEDEPTGRVTRSSVEDEEDWVIDLDAADCKVTDTRKLSRYVIHVPNHISRRIFHVAL